MVKLLLEAYYRKDLMLYIQLRVVRQQNDNSQLTSTVRNAIVVQFQMECGKQSRVIKCHALQSLQHMNVSLKSE